jgi:hypothetical protein
VVFHAYYLQLTHSIDSFPRNTSNTLHTYRPLAKFHANCHFIYITTCMDEIKEELQSNYKLADEDMEETTKDWPTKLLFPVEDTKLSDPNIIGSPLVTQTEYGGSGSTKKNKNKEEV